MNEMTHDQDREVKPFLTRILFQSCICNDSSSTPNKLYFSGMWRIQIYPLANLKRIALGMIEEEDFLLHKSGGRRVDNYKMWSYIELNQPKTLFLFYEKAN